MGSADFAKSIFLRPVELAEALERLAADFEAAEAQYWRGSGVDDSIPNRLQELAEAVELAAEGGLSPIAEKFREGGLDLRAVAEGLRENRWMTLPQLSQFPGQMKRCANSLRQWLEWKAYRQRLDSINVDELFGDLSEPQKPAPAAAPADSATPHVPALPALAASPEKPAAAKPGSTPSASAAGAAETQGASGAVEWSNYRKPADWRVLLEKAKARFTSERGWSKERAKDPAAFDGKATWVRISKAKALELGLRLPEFETEAK